MAINKNQIIETLAKMSVLDIMDLISDMEKKFGVSSSQKITGNSNPLEVKEEKTEFDVIIKEIGTNKIAVIKTVRSIIGLGLKEAKDMVESTPCIIKKGITKKDAEVVKKKLEDAGAKMEIK